MVAAHLHASADVGRASGLFTSVLFVCFATGMGLPVTLSRFSAEDGPDSASLLSWSLVLVGVVSSLAAMLYVVLVDSPATAVLNQRGWLFVLAFALVTMGSALTVLVDVRLMVARRWRWALARVASVGLCQLMLLAISHRLGAPDLALFLAAVGPIALSGFAGVALLRTLEGHPYSLRSRPSRSRTILRYTSVNYVSTLALEAPRFGLPVIVLVNVSPSDNAHFYVAWAIVAVVLLVPAALAQVLLLESGRHGASDAGQLRRVAGAAVALMMIALLAATVLQGLVPAVYGSEYGRAGRLVPLLMAAGIPWALTSVTLADARVRRDSLATLAITLALTATVLLPAVFLVPRHGIAGAVGPWLGGNVAAAAIALLVLCRRPKGVPA
jgi:O-antigen/teichoic acid export membrane protein